MKLLSIAIPCYNSEDYMRYCVESLLPGGDEVEILIVNDGSKDNTAQIADEYASKYPNIVRALHQENGGHGEAVNAGIRNAKGLYFKVVDSDDWVDIRAYLKILEVLRKYSEKENVLDMIISNFVYEKEGSGFKKVMRYDKLLEENKVFGWDDIKTFTKGKYMMMHSLIYRTELLRECNLILPKHTFYVDNLFMYLPLRYVKRMYYVNADFYRYFIGRDDQSVNESVMIKRIDQQIKVNKLMVTEGKLETIENKKLYEYMLSHLEITTAVSSVLLMRSGTKENLAKKKELWHYIKSVKPEIYKELRHRIMGRMINFPGPLGRFSCVETYKLSRKIFGFN